MHDDNRDKRDGYFPTWVTGLCGIYAIVHGVRRLKDPKFILLVFILFVLVYVILPHFGGQHLFDSLGTDPNSSVNTNAWGAPQNIDP